MTEEYITRLVAIKVKATLNYIDKLLEDSKKKKIVLKFYHELINDSDNCILKVIQNNKSIRFNMGVVSEYDYIFYSQLFISILDHYSDNQLLELSSIYNGNENFNYCLCFLYDSVGKINIYIDAVNDLKKVVEYYNEQLVLRNKNTNFRIAGGK